MKITVSVPGKVHLMGEHAVVYGRPALLSAINRRLRVTIEESSSFSIVAPHGKTYIGQALEITKKELGLLSLPHMKITVESEFPAGFHLGSSAAVAVGTVGAVMFYTKKIWNPERINKTAYEVEKLQHGNPSGGDNTTVTFGGLLWYRKELEFLKSMWQLPFTPHKNIKGFFLVNTGKPAETTGDMVTLVRNHVEKDPHLMDHIFNENEYQTKRVAYALKEGNMSELVDAINVGQETLNAMGVVSSMVQPFVKKMQKSGGAVKILGGGGKKKGVGFMLALHEDPELLNSLASQYNYPVESIVLGEEGVRLEK